MKGDAVSIHPLIQSLKGTLIVSVRHIRASRSARRKLWRSWRARASLVGLRPFVAGACRYLGDKRACRGPVIGLWKDGHDGVYITPERTGVRAPVWRPVPTSWPLMPRTAPVPMESRWPTPSLPFKEEGVLTMADCMTIDDIRRAVDLGFDIVSTTLSHGVAAIDCTMADGPDLPLLRQAAEEFPGSPWSARVACTRRPRPGQLWTPAPGRWWWERPSRIPRALRAGLPPRWMHRGLAVIASDRLIARGSIWLLASGVPFCSRAAGASCR